MPVLLEGTAVVIRNDALDRCVEGGASAFEQIAPHAMSFGDEHISQSSFMSPRDAELFREKLVLMGLSEGDEAPDVVLVDVHSQTVSPPCDWLQLLEYKGSLIASFAGHESNVVVAPESWNPDAGPSLHHMSADEVEAQLEFVRRDGKIDVYRNKETGQLLYSARLHDTPAEVFRRAADVIAARGRRPGQPPPPASVQNEIRGAIGDLQRLASRHGETWRQCFLLGKAWHAVDRLPRSIDAFRRAAELAETGETAETVIYKEWAGVLLEAAETARACKVGERAVALKPDDTELLGNLAVAYLLDGRIDAAEKTIDHALHLGEDATNRLIRSRIQQVCSGATPQPRSLVELEAFGNRPASPNRVRPRSGRWWGRLLPRWWKPKQRVTP
jgi:tetratricopeptide (TPR) repeat protein